MNDPKFDPKKAQHDTMVPESHVEIKEILGRAVDDAEFKKLLLSDPDKALEGYNLTEVQRLLIKSLDAGDMEKLNRENLEEYFSADAAVYTPDDVEQLQGYEAYRADDFRNETSSGNY